MSADDPQSLSAAHCHAEAGKCRALARLAATEAQRIMLAHIAETWERIAEAADK